MDSERLASELFRTQVQAITDGEAISFREGERLHLWVVFDGEPDLDTKLRVAEAFTKVYEKYSAIRYNFLMITRDEYNRRISTR